MCCVGVGEEHFEKLKIALMHTFYAAGISARELLGVSTSLCVCECNFWCVLLTELAWVCRESMHFQRTEGSTINAIGINEASLKLDNGWPAAWATRASATATMHERATHDPDGTTRPARAAPLMPRRHCLHRCGWAC